VVIKGPGVYVGAFSIVEYSPLERALPAIRP